MAENQNFKNQSPPFDNHFVSNVSGIGRTLIPRYFRSIFEGGVTDLHYELRHPKEAFHNTTITMDCDQCSVVTLHGKPMFTKVSRFFAKAKVVRKCCSVLDKS